MATVKNFEELKIWQESKDIILEIYTLFKNCKDFGFKDQIQRAALSIMNNIAEGFERNSDADFRRFLIIAKASCGEVRSMLYLTEDLKYLENSKSQELIQRCVALSTSIGSFINYLSKKD